MEDLLADAENWLANDVSPTKGAWLTFDQILRNQTYNYKINYENDGNFLVSEPVFETIEDIYASQGGKDSPAFKYKSPNSNMDFPEWYEKYVNLDPKSEWNNPKGVEVSKYLFHNHNLSVSRPLITTESQKNGTGASDFEKSDGAAFGFDDEIGITPVYNYYLKKYENYFDKSTPISEKVIPNFYHTLFLLDHFQKSDSSFLVSDSISGFLKTVIYFLETRPDKKFAIEFLNEAKDPRERNSVVMLTSDFFKTHSSLIEKQKNVYPFYNKISIPTVKQGTAFRELFKKFNSYDDLQFSTALSLKLLNRLRGVTKKEVKDTVSGFSKKYDIYKLLAIKEGNFLKSSWSKNANFDILEFGWQVENEGLSYSTAEKIIATTWPTKEVDEIIDSFSVPYVNPKETYSNKGAMVKYNALRLLGHGSPTGDSAKKDIWDNIPNFGDQQLPMVFHGEEKGNNDFISGGQKLKVINIIDKLTKIIKLNAPAVLKNQENYSEVMFFEIVKYYGQPNSKSIPIQTFLLPNDPDLLVTEYIDSQIKYGVSYYYQIYAHVLSVGNKMKRASKIGDYDGEYWVYDNDYDIRLLRVPYYNIPEIEAISLNPDNLAPFLDTVNLDAPPMPPNVSFFPYKNVSDKIGFWFNVQMGSAFMVPEYSLLTEEQRNNIMVASKSRLGTDTEGVIGSFGTETDHPELKVPIFYKTDDYGGTFDIFRLTEKPEKYADFKNAKIATVDVVGAKTFVDKVTPNQSYYYIFRAIDVHKMPSNPSPVYHMKMITHNDVPETDSVHIGTSGGQPVLFSEIIHLQDNYEKKIDNKSFKKYLLLEPSLRQTFLNFDNFDIDGGIKTKDDVLNNSKELKFGNSEEKLFDKKFKLRITSKQTGRKVDVNVHFKSPKIYEAEEDE